jgi:hypothetical protein
MSDVLTRPATGSALFVEADRKTILVRRRIKHHCTREEWSNPARRLAKISEAWRLTIANIRSEGETFVSPSPVVLYRDPVSGVVLFADIQLPHHGSPRWIDAQGHALLFSPLTVGLIREPTTYAAWAEGPLPYFGDHAAVAAPDPLQDRNLQRVRHQNGALREKIDAAIAPSFDPIALDAGHDEYVDFRVRGIFSRYDLKTLESKQTGEAAKLVLADGTIDIRDHNPADLTE